MVFDSVTSSVFVCKQPQFWNKQGSIHSKASCMWVGRGSDEGGQKGHLDRSCTLKTLMNAEKVKSCKSVRWSVVPVAPL